MPARRRLVQLACACALALVPAASAQAAVTQVVGLGSASNGIAVGADGNVYVVEPIAQQVTVLAPDGRLVRHVALGGPGATSAELGPDGQVWVAMTGAQRFVRVAPDGTTVSISTAGLFDCGPVGMAPSGGRMFFTAPDTGCGTHGLGSIGPGGEAPATAGAGTNVGFDLAVASGKLYVPMFGDDKIVRRAITGGAPGGIEATYDAPAGASPDGIALGADGNLWVTYFALGQVGRFSPAASNGPTQIVGAGVGLAEPFGLVAHPDGGMYVASHADGHLSRIAADGSARQVPLPAGFHPWQLATVNRDTWVTDNVAAQVGRVVDDVPTARLLAPDGLAVTAEVDPRGNDTAVTLTATPASGGPATAFPAADVAAGIGEQPRGFLPGTLAPGDYALTLTATNARGTTTAGPVALSVPAPPTAPPATPAEKPTFAQVLSVASATRCLSRRQLTLTLRKRKTGSKVTKVTVTIGKRKAKSYTGSKLKVPVRLTGLPKGRFRVKVVVTLADRTQLTLTRTYKTCAPKKRR